MKEETQEKLANLTEKVFTWVGDKASDVSAWASEEIPLFIHEFLMWKFWENATEIIFYIFFLTLLVVFSAYSYRKWAKPLSKTEYKTRSDLQDFLLYVPLPVGLFFTACWFLFAFPKKEIKNCIQIKVAPRVFLVEETARILNK